MSRILNCNFFDATKSDTNICYVLAFFTFLDNSSPNELRSWHTYCWGLAFKLLTNPVRALDIRLRMLGHSKFQGQLF